MIRFGTVLNLFVCSEWLRFWPSEQAKSKKGVMTILSIQECRYLQSFGGQMEDPASTLGMQGRGFL